MSLHAAIDWNGEQLAPAAAFVKDDARSASPPAAVLCIFDGRRLADAILRPCQVRRSLPCGLSDLKPLPI